MAPGSVLSTRHTQGTGVLLPISTFGPVGTLNQVVHPSKNQEDIGFSLLPTLVGVSALPEPAFLFSVWVLLPLCNLWKCTRAPLGASETCSGLCFAGCEGNPPRSGWTVPAFPPLSSQQLQEAPLSIVPLLYLLQMPIKYPPMVKTRSAFRWSAFIPNKVTSFIYSTNICYN